MINAAMARLNDCGNDVNGQPMTKRALQRTRRVVQVIGLSNSNSKTHRSIRPLSESNPVPPDSKTTLPPNAPPPLIEYAVWKLS
ncbi:hypothetical protein EVAR_79877_1 [Eumeta japonica]|uniref:Uncharacterized protein n=1 Tax=Eumeta variegata TaxID=151549 RepID=A0A4C1TZ45_EUMVA|nr:hypothetical protein EVAR_79877_1 [Eumeta japonica]